MIDSIPKDGYQGYALLLCFRMTAIHQTLVLLDEFSKLYNNLPCYRVIFTPVLSMCEKLPRDLYTDAVQV